MKRKWNILAGVVIVILLIAGISAGCRMLRGPSSTGVGMGATASYSSPRAVPPVKLGERIITVTSDRESEKILCLDERGHSLHLVIRILDEYTPYVAYYNGGEEKGGIDVPYPPRRERPPGWKSSKPEGYEAAYVTFRLPAGYPPVQISCTLSRN